MDGWMDVSISVSSAMETIKSHDFFPLQFWEILYPVSQSSCNPQADLQICLLNKEHILLAFGICDYVHHHFKFNWLRNVKMFDAV